MEWLGGNDEVFKIVRDYVNLLYLIVRSFREFMERYLTVLKY